MELDVHITRERDEPWGFELVGGADYEIPLTIDKVLPCSPAHIAGLQAGDVVARLGDRLATDLSLEATNAIVADAIGSLSFGICRGLYDPVLDDYEPIYEPTDRADSDLRSEPTEVLDPLDLSLDDPNILDPRITDPSLWDSGYDTRPVTETRSLTASPFVPNTKPYRPFSTEPLQVPPLDDPIILNPGYKDSLNLNNVNGSIKVLNPEEDELIRILPLDSNVEAKFKLPVSEKYDPEWDKKVRVMLERCAEGGKRENQQAEHELVCYLEQSTATTEIKDLKVTKEVRLQENVISESARIAKEEVKFDQTVKEKCETLSLEETALELVEESIERAVSVTEDIKKEIEEELRVSITRELQLEESQNKAEIDSLFGQVDTQEKKKYVGQNVITESVEKVTEMSEEVKQEAEIRVTKNKEILEKLKQDEKFVEQTKLTTKKEIEETIESGNVRQKSPAYENKAESSMKDQKQTSEESKEFGTVERQSIAFEEDKVCQIDNEGLKKISQDKEIKSEHRQYKKSSEIINETSGGKQKAYMIGLQTIPHIKGFVQSSYHFDLLLRTFFVHLTDVMVALSRFILTQPAQELESKSEKVVEEKLIKEFAKESSEHFERKETNQSHELTKKRSGAVIETKRQEKDVRQETTAVEALKEKTVSKSETLHQQHKEVKQEKKEEQEKLDFANSLESSKNQESINLEDLEMKKISGAEMAQRTQRKSKDLTRKMDAVINEFEIKTGIDERLEVTEQRIRRSRSRSQIEEEVSRESDPLDWLDKVDSKRSSQEQTNVTTNEKGFHTYSESKESKKSDFKHESRTTKVKPGKQMYVAIVESHVYTNEDAILEDQVAELSETASVKSSEEITAASESLQAISTEKVTMSNFIQSEEKQQAVEVIANALQEVVQDKQEILEEVIDIKSQVVESYSDSLVQESHASIAAETTEIIDEAKLESFETKETVTENAVVTSEKNYQEVAQSATQVVLEAKEQQAVFKLESLAIAVAKSTDVVVDDSKVETFESEQILCETAKVSSEEAFKKAAVGITDVAFETAEEKHSELGKTSEVTIKEEGQHLSVAGIIETRTEFCKEPIKPAEDEYVSLKIVKEQIIDAEESTEILMDSELNVQQSVDVQLSLQHTQSSISEDSYQSINKESTLVQQSSSLVQDSSSLVQESSSLVQDFSSLVQESSSLVQESSTLVQDSTTTSCKSTKSLHLDTSLTPDGIDENNNTPTPTTVPPTPLTDEYVFKLEIPLPKNQGTVVIEESPDREDPHIVKKGLVPYIETTIEEQIIYDPPLPTPPEDRVHSPVYTKPGLRGGAQPLFRKEYIREIERKSSLLASAIDETIKSIEEYKEEVGIDKSADVTIPLPRRKSTSDTCHDVTIQLSKPKIKKTEEEGMTNGHANGQMNGANGTEDGATETDVPGFKPVVFNPEAYQARLYEEVTRGLEPPPVEVKPYLNESGEPLGTVQGIVDGLEDATVDEEVAKELGKPGITEDKIAVLISGESEMLREAHVMGLTRVLTSHMTRPDDSSVDFQKIKPLVPSLKDSEVIKALNEEMKRECEKKKKESTAEEKKWTTFLQKPKRPVPKVKFGYPGYVEPEEDVPEEPYKVKIVKQPKPKVAPDYKPEDFDTGPLPWEQRALLEPVPSPVPPEEPILIPEQAEFFEAVDPLPESEVPDLEDTGIPLPPSPPPVPPADLPPEPAPPEAQAPEETEPTPEEPEEPEEVARDMDQNRMAEQLVSTVKGMVDPNAPLEQQLCQMRAQLAALAQLPCVIQQSLELLTRQLSNMSRQETHQMGYEAQMNVETRQEVHETSMASIQEYQEQEAQNCEEVTQNGQELAQNDQDSTQKEEQSSVTIEEVQEETMSAEEAAALKREQDAMIEEQMRSEKDKKIENWNKIWPWGDTKSYCRKYRVNFMKYEKPPVSLDHLKNSATYKMIHNLEDAPLRRTDLLTPVVAEADYRERCGSATPIIQTNGRM